MLGAGLASYLFAHEWWWVPGKRLEELEMHEHSQFTRSAMFANGYGSLYSHQIELTEQHSRLGEKTI